MKRAYTFALAGALALAPLALPGTAEAQERGVRPSGGPGVAAGILQHRAELGLTPQQEQQLTAIAERLRAQNQPLMEQIRASGAMQRGQRSGEARHGHGAHGTMSPEQRAQMREHMQNMTPEQRAQMREQMQAMTPEQRAQMQERMQNMTPEQRAEMHERMQSMTPEQRAAMRGQMRQRGADVTPEQREQMRARMQERRAAGERGARVERGERGARVPEEVRPLMEQMRANSQAAMQEARAVLTAEQLARLQQLREQRRPAAGERGQRGRGFRAPGAGTR
jgi:Spy/CpxP family protein refolding chaperone